MTANSRVQDSFLSMTLLLLLNQPAYHKTLLGLAQTLHDEGRYQLSVVTAQMACEVVGEQVLSALLSVQVGELEGAVLELVPSHHLAHDKVQALFDGLTGATLASEPWWPGYRAHVKRRNGIVHRGARVEETGSSDSLKVASAFCSHVRGLAPT